VSADVRGGRYDPRFVDVPVTITVEGGEASSLRYTYDNRAGVWIDAAGERVTPGEMLLLLNDVCYGVFEKPQPTDTWRRWRRR
jgi:hypothetical protein